MRILPFEANENTLNREFDYNTLIQYRSMHRIYALKYTEASKSFNQFSNTKRISANSEDEEALARTSAE